MVYFTEGLLLGITVGVSCVVTCLPVVLGMNVGTNFRIAAGRIVVSFFLGKLIAYLLVGVFAGFIGQTLNIDVIQPIKTGTNLIIAGLLIYWGIKGYKTYNNDHRHYSCRTKGMITTTPFLAGLFTGLSPCPPFIAGISRVITLSSWYKGLWYFLGFYLSSSLFVLPSFLTSFLKYKKEMKLVGAFFSLIYGVIFLFNEFFTALTLLFY